MLKEEPAAVVEAGSQHCGLRVCGLVVSCGELFLAGV